MPLRLRADGGGPNFGRRGRKGEGRRKEGKGRKEKEGRKENGVLMEDPATCIVYVHQPGGRRDCSRQRPKDGRLNAALRVSRSRPLTGEVYAPEPETPLNYFPVNQATIPGSFSRNARLRYRHSRAGTCTDVHMRSDVYGENYPILVEDQACF